MNELPASLLDAREAGGGGGGVGGGVPVAAAQRPLAAVGQADAGGGGAGRPAGSDVRGDCLLHGQPDVLDGKNVSEILGKRIQKPVLKTF